MVICFQGAMVLKLPTPSQQIELLKDIREGQGLLIENDVGFMYF